MHDPNLDPDGAMPSRWTRPLILRGVAIAIAIASALLWRFHEPGYGPLFWLWGATLVAYIASFDDISIEEAPTPTGIWLCLGLLLVIAAALRFPDVYDIPANVSIDELLPGLESKHLADGSKPNAFGSIGWFTIPNFAFLPAAVLMKIAPLEPFHALRVTSGLLGLGGIIATFLLGRRLLGSHAAMAAAFFMAAGFWHIHNSRTGFPYTQSSFAPPLALFMILRAQQRQSRRAFALAGVVSGFLLQMYFPVRILVVLCPLFLLATWRERHLPFRLVVGEAAVFAVGAALALAPLVCNAGPAALLEHSSEILITRPAVLHDLEARYHLEGLTAVLQHQLWEASRMFTQKADVAVLNLSPAGLLDRGTLAMFLAGLVMVGLSGGTAPLLLLAWLAVTLVFGVAFTNAPRSSYRLAAAMPAIYMIAAYAVDRVLAATYSQRAWYRYTVRLGILLALGSWVLAENHRLFFEEYTHGDGKQAPWPEALRFMASHCDGRHFYVLPKSENFGDAEFVDLFCPSHKSIDARDIPGRIDSTAPVTFLVMGQAWSSLGALNRCYPAGDVTQHKNRDGLPLFTSVDVSVDQLVEGQARCAPKPADDANGKQRT